MAEGPAFERNFCFLNAGLFLIAASLYGASALGFLGPADPVFDTSQPIQAQEQVFFEFYRADAGVQILLNVLAVLAFLSLLPVAVVIGQALGPDGVLPSLSTVLISAGATILVIGQVLFIGSVIGVSNASQWADADLYSLDQVQTVLKTISDWVENAGYLGVGLGIAAAGAGALGSGRLPGTWARFSFAVALGYLAIVVTQATETWSVYDAVLVIGGVVLAPAWAIWLGRILGRA